MMILLQDFPNEDHNESGSRDDNRNPSTVSTDDDDKRSNESGRESSNDEDKPKKETNSDQNRHTGNSTTKSENTTDARTENRTSKLKWTLVGIGSAFIVLLLLIAIIVCIRKKNRNERNTSLQDIDENDIYGTYGRGWDGEGLYGDGDKVYVTDTNDYYAVS